MKQTKLKPRKAQDMRIAQDMSIAQISEAQDMRKIDMETKK